MATPWIETRDWREEELSVRGVLGVEDMGPSIATLIRMSLKES